MSSSAVDITLLGRTYSIACPEGRESALKSVANKLEKQLTTVNARANHLSREEIAIMAALNIGYELLEEQIKNQDYMKQMDERIGLLQSTLENALVDQISKPRFQSAKKEPEKTILEKNVVQIEELSVEKD